MFCENCGKRLSDSAHFCPYCGTAVAPALSSGDPAPASPATPASSQSPAPGQMPAPQPTSPQPIYPTAENFPPQNTAAPPTAGPGYPPPTAPTIAGGYPPQPTSPPETAKPRKKHTGVIVTCVILAVLLLAGAVAAVVYFTPKKIYLDDYFTVEFVGDTPGTLTPVVRWDEGKIAQLSADLSHRGGVRGARYSGGSLDLTELLRIEFDPAAFISEGVLVEIEVETPDEFEDTFRVDFELRREHIRAAK